MTKTVRRDGVHPNRVQAHRRTQGRAGRAAWANGKTMRTANGNCASINDHYIRVRWRGFASTMGEGLLDFMLSYQPQAT